MDPIKTNAGSNYLTEKEEKKFFSTLKNRKEPQAERDFVLLKICRMTALRRQEMVNLNVGDVANTDRIICNERIAVKGGLGEVFLSLESQEIIKKFLRLKKKWGESTDDDAPLFVSKKGARLSPRSVNDLMAKWCKESGIPVYTPHALRHTKAHRILADCSLLEPEERDRKLRFANKQLRHKSMGATLVYTEPTKEQMERVGDI